MESAAIEQELPQHRPTPIGSPLLRGIASFISYIFHPVFMPVLLSVVIWRIQPAAFAGMTHQTLVFRLITMVMLTVFFPLLTVVLLKALGFLKSIHMRVSNDRVIPLIATMTFYFWAQQVFSHLP